MGYQKAPARRPIATSKIRRPNLEQSSWGAENEPDEEEPEVKKGHPHAHLMAMYAEDAAKIHMPWLWWESCSIDDDSDEDASWGPLDDHPKWELDREYRRRQYIDYQGVNIPIALMQVLKGYYSKKSRFKAPDVFRIENKPDDNGQLKPYLKLA